MAIYYWRSQGRLGNLLLQLATIEHIKKEKDIVLTYDVDLNNPLFRNRKYIIISFRSLFGNFLARIIDKLIRYLGEKKVITMILPQIGTDEDGEFIEEKELNYTKGLIKDLYYIKGYFQYDDWVCGILKHEKNNYEKIRSKLDVLAGGGCTVGVHVRLTDYNEWSVYGKKGVLLSAKWYNDAINHIKSIYPEAKFVFFSDDESGLFSFGIDDPIIFYRGKNATEDLMALSLCDHAIISPSTFGYCAALSGYKEGKIIIAPKYWAGFKSNKWFPAAIQSDKIVYSDVN